MNKNVTINCTNGGHFYNVANIGTKNIDDLYEQAKNESTEKTEDDIAMHLTELLIHTVFEEAIAMNLGKVPFVQILHHRDRGVGKDAALVSLDAIVSITVE